MAGKPGSSQPQAATVHSAARAVWTSYALMALWITLSATVILFNKYVLSYAGFPYPIALTMVHMAFSSALSALLVHHGQIIGIYCDPVALTAGTCVPGGACPKSRHAPPPPCAPGSSSRSRSASATAR